ncbi:hypothetical protein Tsubulata_002163 [Turnera subulata]|uniref:Uncharacterized protein n=1 Tax=Turnera subulata TaxID=218843 RepID=A0A9Q0FJ25_9ROSI|nr:hypothetical protein Tsubulata_002163 [Turnera subulata]
MFISSFLKPTGHRWAIQRNLNTHGAQRIFSRNFWVSNAKTEEKSTSLANSIPQIGFLNN